MVVDADDDDFQKWRDIVQRALWDCFGMTAETFGRTYHGPELRRWFNDPARPQTHPAQAAAVMIRYYTSRQWEAFPTPGADARRWWEETLASRDPADRTGKAIIVMARLHEADLPGPPVEPVGFEPLTLPPEMEL